jgi:hypothetical protein
MIMGPEPMMRIDFRSVRRGMDWRIRKRDRSRRKNYRIIAKRCEKLGRQGEPVKEALRYPKGLFLLI